MHSENLKQIVRPVAFSEIDGWAEDDHCKSLETFARSQQEFLTSGHGFKRDAIFGGKHEDWRKIAGATEHSKDPRYFFESQFTPFTVLDPERPQGLFTGYYEPEAEGSVERKPGYDVPIYRKPAELVAFNDEEKQTTGLGYGLRRGGKPEDFFTRKEIEQGALNNRGLEIAWLKNWIDAFFIHIQGSGRIRLEDGKTIRLAYAGKNGQPYSGIGSVLLARGVATPETMSMQVLRSWMADHPEQARDLMWNNKSYIFFREVDVPDPELGALGAQQVFLTPQRSLAVDRSIWMFGTPIWLDTKMPIESPGGAKPFKHLMIAQDTGTAIRGHVRGDVYWGWSEHAALIAGNMKSPGRMIVLLPNFVAQTLALIP